MDETCSESKIHLAILKFEIRKIIPLLLGSTSRVTYLQLEQLRNSSTVNILNVQYIYIYKRENFKRSFHENILPLLRFIKPIHPLDIE